MNAKSFLIAHGEKLAVVLVAGGVALVVSQAINDPLIRPKEDQKAIEEKNAKIDKVFKNQAPPVMKEPRPYLDQLLARVGESAPVTPLMAWLTNPPDKSRTIIVRPPVNGDPGGVQVQPGQLYPYIYELQTPSVTIEDAIGAIRITIVSPEAGIATAGRRISSEAARTWERTDRAGKIENGGRHLGYQLEMQVGKDGPWKPLVLPGAGQDGVMPIDGLPAGPITLPTLEPWQRHAVRIRLIAAATALDIDRPIPERPRYTVLVHPGPASPGPTQDASVLEQATAQITAKKGDLFSKLLRPVKAPLPAGAKLGDYEKLFVGPWSDPEQPGASVTPTASVRLGLVGLSTTQDPADPKKSRDVGRFLVLKLFEQGGERKWMEKPLEEKFGVGDKVEIKDINIPNPFAGTPGQPKTIRVTLDTPFVVDKLVKDQERVLYWMVKPAAREGGGKDKRLLLDSKKVSTDIVELKNPASGYVLVLTKLVSINPPGKSDVLIFPHRAAALVEREEFLKSPADFTPYGLLPEQPKPFKPGTGPLKELHEKKLAEGALDAASYETDTEYFVFPDGRIAWWELVEHSLKVHDPKGVMSAKPTEAAPPAPAPDAPPPEAAPPGPAPAPKGKAGKQPVPPPGMPPDMGPPPRHAAPRRRAAALSC